MSGGAFNYVSVVSDVGGLLDQLCDLQRLRGALAEYPGSELAIAETDAVIAAALRLDRELFGLGNGTLRDIWQAVEWNHSDDCGSDAVTRALERHRARIAENTPSLAAKHAKVALDRMPGGANAWPGLLSLIAGAIAAALEERGEGGAR